MNREKLLTYFSRVRSFSFISWLLTALIIVSIILLAGNQGSYFWLIPAGLALVLGALLDVRTFLFIVIFLVPLSVQMRFLIPEADADLFLPTEPMLFIVLLIMLIKAFARQEIEKDIIRHPVSILTALLLIWIFICALTGTMPVVSLKYFLSRLWFIAAFYLLASQLFLKYEDIRLYFSAYLLGMTPVAAYYLVRLSGFGVLNQETAYSAIRPFFNDHTALGASLAFCIPVTVYLFISDKGKPLLRIFRFFQLLLFSTAFVYSYSRAAWISLAVSAAIVLVIMLRISWKLILPLAVAAIVTIAVSWQDIILKLGENRQDSSLVIEKQLRSIYNIRTDVSNLERINRWKSALRMAEERPVFGWGPGTYQFEYAPFQLTEDKTEISTNWGELGNAHSEYLGLMAEAGVPGMVIYILLLAFISRSAYIVLKNSPTRNEKILLIGMVAGLLTYVVHGTLNNFLDTDKISALFWGSAAAIIAMEISIRKRLAGSAEIGSND